MTEHMRPAIDTSQSNEVPQWFVDEAYTLRTEDYRTDEEFTAAIAQQWRYEQAITQTKQAIAAGEVSLDDGLWHMAKILAPEQRDLQGWADYRNVMAARAIAAANINVA